jgi:hypothetical protein
MHFYPVALSAFAQVAQKLSPISIIAENRFPPISACRDVMHRTGKRNPRRS